MDATTRTIEVRVIRDVRTVWFRFVEAVAGSGLPTGIDALGRWSYTDLDGRRGVMVKGDNGEKMPCLTAEDFCRDQGYEVKRVGFAM